MALMDIITQAGGEAVFEQIGAKVGLTPAQTRSAAAALLPALAGGLKGQAGTIDLGSLLGGGGVNAALGAGLGAAGASTDAGNQVLGQIFGSKEVSRTVAANAAASTGLDVGQLKALLPLLASVSAGALASKGGLQGGLMDMLDQDGDGNPLNDIMGMAGKFLGR